MVKWILPLLIMCLLAGCAFAPASDPAATDVPVWLNMNTEFPQPRTMEKVNGTPVKVILLLGQSNATGCGLNSYLEKNLGISENTNGAARLACGDYIMLLDHDDTLAPEALYEFAAAVARTGADVLYSDEDKMSMDGRTH
jgi:hypothetical protein